MLETSVTCAVGSDVGVNIEESLQLAFVESRHAIDDARVLTEVLHENVPNAAAATATLRHLHGFVDDRNGERRRILGKQFVDGAFLNSVQM